MSLFSRSTPKPAIRSKAKPSAKTSSKSKVVSGGIKTRNKKKFAFFSLVGILALSVLGYSGYVLYQNHSHSKLAKDFQAHAANYGAIIGSSHGVTARACWKQYPTTKPDEVWVMVGKPAKFKIASYVGVNVPGQPMRSQAGDSWWSNVVQLYKIPVGRANINKGAYLMAGLGYENRGFSPLGPMYKTTGGNGLIFSGNGSLTSSYKGARTAVRAYTGWDGNNRRYINPQVFYLPLVSKLPVCDY